MKNLNQSRKIDALGRLVIPSKLRDKFSIESGDEMKFYSYFVDGVQYICIPCPHAPEPRED